MHMKWPKRSYLFPLVSGIACLLFMSGCLKPSEFITDRIGIALAPRNNNWGAAVSKFGTVKAASYSLPYYLANAQSSSTLTDSASQRAQLINMAYPEENPCRVIILSPVGQDARSLDTILKAQIPLIFFERAVENVEYAYLVTGDNEQAGQQAATFIQDTLGATPPHVLILEAADTNYQIRIRAFRTQLGIPTIDSLVNTPSKAAGKAMMLSVLESEGAEAINAVYTADDDLALGVLEALNEQLNTTVKVVVGCGGEQKLLDLIQSDNTRAIATTRYAPEMIQSCVEIAYRIAILGETPDQKEEHHPSVLIDRSNLAEYLNPESYY